MSITLHIFFEDPWWVGLFTITEGDTSKYCRVVFGQKPLDPELYDYINVMFNSLEFSDSIPLLPEKDLSKNPKIRQRQISKQLHDRSRPKASWEIIKEIIEQSKENTRSSENRQRKADRNAFLFSVKQQKRKEKHKGH